MKKKSVLLIGLGRFGKHIAEKLNELGHDVMAVDRDESRVNKIMPLVTNGQIGDSSSEEFLSTLGIKNYDVCIVAIGGDFQSSLETTCLLKDMGARKVISRAERDGQAKLLIRNGADEVVFPEKQLAAWTAIRCCSDHILDYIEIDSSCSIFEISVPEVWVGKSIAEIDVRKKYKLNIVAIKSGSKIDPSFTPDMKLGKDQALYVFGSYDSIKKIIHS